MTSQPLRSDWRAIRVHPHASMLQTMAVLSDGRLGIALVVDEQDRLIGTVTDGDMRRAILGRMSLDTPVSEVMEREFTTVAADITAQDALSLMHEKAIRQLPVCNTESKVVGIYVLEDLIEPVTRPNWAIIMAGGEGRRLWPLTEFVPKPMLPVGSQPVLEHVLAQLLRHGFRRVFISINYLGEQIVRHFGDGMRFGCSIEYLREDQPRGTGGSLSMLPGTPEHPVLVTNGDLLTNANLSELMAHHEAGGASATLCVHELTYQVPYGIVQCEGDEVMAIDEKPTQTELVNAGIYVLDPGLLTYVPSDGGDYPLPELIQEARTRGLKVGAYPIKDEWMDLGHLEEYDRMREGQNQQHDGE